MNSGYLYTFNNNESPQCIDEFQPQLQQESVPRLMQAPYKTDPTGISDQVVGDMAYYQQTAPVYNDQQPQQQQQQQQALDLDHYLMSAVDFDNLYTSGQSYLTSQPMDYTMSNDTGNESTSGMTQLAEDSVLGGDGDNSGVPESYVYDYSSKPQQQMLGDATMHQQYSPIPEAHYYNDQSLLGHNHSSSTCSNSTVYTSHGSNFHSRQNSEDSRLSSNSSRSTPPQSSSSSAAAAQAFLFPAPAPVPVSVGSEGSAPLDYSSTATTPVPFDYISTQPMTSEQHHHQPEQAQQPLFSDSHSASPSNSSVSVHSTPQSLDHLQDSILRQKPRKQHRRNKQASHSANASPESSSGGGAVDAFASTIGPDGKPRYECPICHHTFKRDLPRHIRTHADNARFKCPWPRDHCNHKRGQFNRPYDFKKHLLHGHFAFDDPRVRGYKDLRSKLAASGICTCGAAFTAKDWIDNHITTDEVQWQCPTLKGASCTMRSDEDDDEH